MSAEQLARDVEAARARLESSLTPALVTALAALPESGAVPPEAARRTIAAAYQAVVLASLGATLAFMRKRGSVTAPEEKIIVNDRETQRHVERVVAQRSAELADTATGWAAEHIVTLRESGRETSPPDRAWAEQASRSMSTQATAQAQRDAVTVLQPALEEVGPAGLDLDSLAWKKIWISRGDSRVRKLHRQLHGRDAMMDDPFWTWPLSGQVLRFPGDERAPMEQWINCRCLLFYVPVEVSSSEIADALAPADFDKSFDLVASGHVEQTDFERERERA